jgi:Protein of unknown function (DUF2950)
MKQETVNTISRGNQKPSMCAQPAMISFTILAMWAMTCADPVLAQQSRQQTFQSAAEAGQSLFQAVQHNNVQAIKNILGGSTELISCGDAAQDKVERQLFVQKYQEMHRLGREDDGSVTLYIGAENWPFPVPLVEKNGAWRFDPDAGLKEVLFRRIGDNELTVITICHEFVAAEKQHRPQSDNANPEDSLPASLLAQAAGESTSHDPVLLHGYYFRVLEARPAGGFTLTAYPAEYRSSGVMTFLVADNDVVYQKDLGSKTSKLASAMTTFHKDATWHISGE